MKTWLLAVCCTAVAGVASAQVKPEAAIHYRQSVYEVIVWNFGTLSAMVRGKIPYEKSVFERHATRVAQLAPMLLEGFPKGSESGAMTEAKAEIWTSWTDFQTRMKAFENESATLARMAKTANFEALKVQFGKVGGTCKGCHDHYKAD